MEAARSGLNVSACRAADVGENVKLDKKCRIFIPLFYRMADPGIQASRRGLQWVSTACWILVATAIFNLAFNCLLWFAGPQPFRIIADDSLMLVRYADNLLGRGVLAWNPDGPATYGLTSPYFFLFVVTPVTKFLSQGPITLGVWSSLISGVLFFCSVPVMIYRFIPGAKIGKSLALAATFVSLAWSEPDMVPHLLGGMDALFGLLYFTTYICCLSWHAEKRSFLSALLAGIVGGLAFGARPDLLIYSIVVPACWFFVARIDRRSIIVMSLATALTILAQVIFSNSYFQSPLPLSFYAKSLKLYPGLAGYGLTSLYSFVFFVQSYWLLFLLIIADAALNWKRWRTNASGLEKGLIAGLIAHIGYLLIGVTPIMGQHQRFNYADLPAIIFLAATAAARMWDGMSSASIQRLELLAPKYQAVIYVAGILLMLPRVTNVQPIAFIAAGKFASLDLTQEYLAYETPYWFALDGFSALPDDLEIGATEVGHIAAMNRKKRVIDFSGLNETRFAHHRFSSQELFRVYAPDLIYMPHPAYRGMVADLENDPTFQSRYVFLRQQDTGNLGTGIALRRDSKFYPAMREVVTKACAGLTSPRCDLSKMTP